MQEGSQSAFESCAVKLTERTSLNENQRVIVVAFQLSAFMVSNQTQEEFLLVSKQPEPVFAAPVPAAAEPQVALSQSMQIPTLEGGEF